MALLSEEVAKLEAERRDLMVCCAEATRLAVGSPVQVFHHQGHYVLGHEDPGETGTFIDVQLSRDLANEIACTANGVTVSGRR